MTTSRPILFSAPMVRALLAGTKTQTRRVFKLPRGASWYESMGGERSGWTSDNNGPGWAHVDELVCRHGRPGDRLWVRETFQYRGASYDGLGIEEAEWFRCYGQGGAPDNWDPEFPIGWEPSSHMNVRKLIDPGEQEGDGITGWVTKRIPGIHMPRWASRITLEIESVRVERLQDISEADAEAEGVRQMRDGSGTWVGREGPGKLVTPWLSARGAYRDLWESINGPGSWDANPWCWAITFRLLK